MIEALCKQTVRTIFNTFLVFTSLVGRCEEDEHWLVRAFL
jgi:hypothetical protein